MAVILYQVQIDSNNVMDYIKTGTVERTFGDSISRANITLRRNVTSVVTPAVGDRITIKRGEDPNDDTYFLFDGYIVDVKIDFGHYKIKCYDKIFDLVSKEIHYSYDAAIDPSAGVITEIIDDMIETYGDLTCTINGGGSGSVNVIDRFVCRHSDIYEKVNQLLEVIDYQMYYDPDTSAVIVEPKGYTLNSNVLYCDVSGQTTNVTENPKWKYDNRKLFNNLVVEGATSEVETTETFDGDSSTTNFPLAHIPVSVKVFVGGTLQVGGIENSTETFDYSVDRHKDSPAINFETGSTPGTGTDNIEVRYSYDVPVPVNLRDDVSISNYYEVQKTVYLPDVENVDDAIEQGQALLDKYSTPFINGVVKLDSTVIDVNPGEQIRVDDDVNNEDRTLTIRKVKHTIPFKPDEITLGDEEYKTADWGRGVELKLKRLLEKFTGDQDILTSLVRSDFDIDVTPYSTTILSKKIYDMATGVGKDTYTINSVADQGIYLDRMEVVGNWADGGGTATFSLSQNSNTTYIQVGSYSLKCDWTGGTGDASILDSTTSLGDLSAYTGQSSGTPSQGTVGLWVYLAAATDLTGDITLKIGSGASNYTETTGREYTSSNVYGLEIATWVTGWNYVMFDLDGGSETGTPDWTAVDYVNIEFNTNTASGTLYVDYLTISKSNYLGLNGAGGDRRGAEVTEFTVTY